MIPLLKPFFDSHELEEIKKVLKSGWVSQGPKTREFEENAASYLGTGHTIAVSNCTAALHLSLLTLGVGKGDEVLVADYTFPATGHAVLFCGAKPVFVDIDPKTYNMDPASMEKRITERTNAVIPVHTFGQPVDMDAVLKLAKDHNLKVIEDAACAFGALYKGKQTGTMGDIGCFSFHARKGITTGEGGMACTNLEALAKRLRLLSVFGMTTAWDRENSGGFVIPEFTDMGFNYKMSDITAAVGVAQLRRIEGIIAKKQALAAYWGKKLEEIELISPPYVSPNVRHIYQSYVALVDPSIDRNKLITRLGELGVQAQIGTYASHIQPVYKSTEKCPNSLDIYHRALALPMYYTLEEKDIDVAAKQLINALRDLK